MNEKMRSCVMGLILGQFGVGTLKSDYEPVVPDVPEPDETDAYIHDSVSQTLTVKDETALNFGFSWDTMRMDVGVKA